MRVKPGQTVLVYEKGVRYKVNVVEENSAYFRGHYLEYRARSKRYKHPNGVKNGPPVMGLFPYSAILKLTIK